MNKIYHYEKEKCDLAVEFIEKMKQYQATQVEEGLEVKYYKGVEGFRSVYSEMLNDDPKEFMGWINFEAFYKGIDLKHDKEWTQQRVKQKVFARLIASDTKLSKDFQKKDQKLLREIRRSSSVEYSSACILYENHICIFDPSKEFSGMRIKSPEMFKMFRAIFKVNWSQLGEQNSAHSPRASKKERAA